MVRLEVEQRYGLILRQEANGSWHRIGFLESHFDPEKPYPPIITADWPKREFTIV
ncbi:hypothetical protein M406DRAFT_357152 [Cryphonectria parasitica EP155]|uniref:Uncharacterized protein n=1 Tax=Cryphonectria parasitica (strain ATCC 38755 / EP155) TaxID=660469 RepID=A0A9P4XZ31_CRYP1|nr:uncharacterized protein M406DRAFT_357152 [Cryphonectria parasitica EP155]KAF3763648.1 hypothetical protein M406DRAFT_357152 [Cryphonectria parasitica EP155]